MVRALTKSHAIVLLALSTFPGLVFGLVVSTPPAVAQGPILVSADSFGVPGNGTSLDPSVSANGRFVAFSSDAPNLVSGDNNGVRDVFLRDVWLGTTRRVSVSSIGAEGNDTSGNEGQSPFRHLALSADGQRVAFESKATNLVPGGMSPNQVYVYDLTTGQTSLVSTLPGTAREPSISDDGRYVAMQWCPGGSCAEWCVRDLQMQTTFSPGIGGSFPVMSGNGRYVAFQSGSASAICDRDMDQDGVFDEPGQFGTIALPDAYRFADFSPDGRYVCGSDNQGSRTLLHDRDADADGAFDEPGQTTTITASVLPNGLQHGDFASVSANGQLVAFRTNGSATWYVRDIVSAATEFWSFNPQTGQQANETLYSARPELSDDGQWCAISSVPGNLIPGTFGNAQVILLPRPIATCTPPSTYCVGAPNSVGFGAQIGWTGSLRLAENSFYLTVSGCPPNATGLFFYGPDQQQVAFYNGYLCISPGTLGLFRAGTNTANVLGQVVHQIRFDLPPAAFGSGQITPGSAWNFQFWYRNPGGGGAGANTSNALHASFCP